MQTEVAPIHVDRASFEAEVLKSDVPVVIDFWAPWCGPCRAIAPVLDELAKKYAGQVKVAKINVDEQPELAGAFRVSGIPTIAFLSGGKVVGSQVGFRGRPALEAAFAELAKGQAA